MMRRASSPPTVRARRRSRGETGLHSFLPYNVYRFGEGMEGNNNRGGKVGTLLGGKIGSNISRGKIGLLCSFLTYNVVARFGEGMGSNNRE